MLKPINVLGGFYTDDTLPFANQDTVNYIPEIAQVSDGARNVAILKTVPANRAITLNSWDTGATQAHLVVDNTLYLVVDGALFKVGFGVEPCTLRLARSCRSSALVVAT